MPEIGKKGTAKVTVSEQNTAKTMGSGSLEVFATPALVALMEAAACNCLADALEEGTTTVGTAMNIQHVSATPTGMEVTAEAELTAVEGRKFAFTVRAFDGAGLIGEGTHERFLVQSGKFTARANSKREGSK